MNHICNKHCQSYNCYYDNNTIQGVMLMEHLMADAQPGDTCPKCKDTLQPLREGGTYCPFCAANEPDHHEAYDRAMGILGGIK